MATTLSPYLPTLAAALLLMLIAVITATVLALRRLPGPFSRVANSEEERDWQAARRRLRAALRRLAGGEAVPDHPYAGPWIALLGPPDADLAGFHRAIDPAVPGDAAANTVEGPHCTIHFCRDGALIEAEDDLLEGEGWRDRLDRLSRLLSAERPKRPLDGLVLAIPAAWLTGPTMLSADRLTAEGTRIYEAIWALQRRTGLRVPLYLVISGAERFAGFPGLVAALDAGAREETLGWTAPYGIDAAFRPEWIDEAVDRVVAGLGGLQLQAFAAGTPADPAALLLLPQALAAAAERLRSVVGAMLRSGAYHEAFLFRGLYIAGRDADGAPVFLHGLLTDLVLREYRLARPAHGVVTQHGRQIQGLRRAVIGIAALTFLCAFFVDWVMAARRDALKPVLSALEDVLQPGGDIAAPSAASAQHPLTARLLQSLAGLDSGHLSSLAAPTSYLEHPSRRVGDAIAVGYNALVLRVIRDNLEAKPLELLPMPQGVPDCGVPGADPLPPSDPAEAESDGRSAFDRWRDAVAAMVTLDANVRLYDGLDKARRIDDLAQLARYAAAFDLPPDFETNADVYQAAFDRAQLPLLRLDAGQAGKRIAAAFQAAAAERFGVGRLDQAADLVLSETKALQAAGAGIDPAEALSWLTALHGALGDLAAAAGTVSPSAALGVTLTDPINRLNGLAILPDTLPDQLHRIGFACRDAAAKRAAALAADSGNPLLVVTGRGFELAGSYKALSAALDMLLAQPFVQTAAVPADLVLPSQGILWDAAILRQALDAVGSYRTLQGQLPPGVPPELAPGIRAALHRQIVAYAVDRLHEAAKGADGALSPDPQTARRAEIQAFAAAAGALSELRDAFDLTGLNGLAGQIGAAADAQAEHLLADVDQVLRKTNLYAPLDPGFSGWDGTPPLAQRSFGAGSADELAALLAGQRNFVAELAGTEAQPLVSFLRDGQPPRQESALANRWAGIIDALARYDHKVPDGSLAVLERFIATDMDRVTPGTCAATLAAAVPAANYFGERLSALEQGVLQRCDALERDRLQKGYAGLAVLFNQSLAGHFPFAPEAGAGQQAIEADPDDIRRFYREFDVIEAEPLQPRLRTLLGTAGDDAAEFLDRLAAARQVLQPMLADTPADAPLTLEADVDFRPNPSLEAPGDQVLEWTLDAGDQHLSSLDGTHVLDWSYGQPLKIVLRWAHAAAQAAASTDAPKMREVMAAWNYTDPWALLAFLHQQDAARDPGVPAPARQPETVLMTMPRQRNPAAAGVPAESDVARLFLRLRLATVIRMPGQPDKRVAVTLPPFPATAPVL
jgi:hypothetical protein